MSCFCLYYSVLPLKLNKVVQYEAKLHATEEEEDHAPEDSFRNV